MGDNLRWGGGVEWLCPRFVRDGFFVWSSRIYAEEVTLISTREIQEVTPNKAEHCIPIFHALIHKKDFF